MEEEVSLNVSILHGHLCQFSSRPAFAKTFFFRRSGYRIGFGHYMHIDHRRHCSVFASYPVKFKATSFLNIQINICCCFIVISVLYVVVFDLAFGSLCSSGILKRP